MDLWSSNGTAIATDFALVDDYYFHALTYSTLQAGTYIAIVRMASWGANDT